MKSAHWKIRSHNSELAKSLSINLNIKMPIAQLLINRGIDNPDSAYEFLYPALSRIPSPNLIKDIEIGVIRVINALKNHEKICIYGDYDADGITACALMVLFFKELRADVTYYVPDRIKEGYGLNNNAILKLKSEGVKLIITVDCGIRDHDAVKYGNSIGIDFIITDHHIPTSTMPEAVAVINPKREDCSFPFKELAGCGVAFYFLIALRSQLRKIGVFTALKEPNLKEYLDLVAIGTVADMVPLTGPNRIFVKYGLQEILRTKKKGLKILRENLLLDTLDVKSISFRMAPRINASGRVDSPLEALKLLMTSDEEKAKKLVSLLNDSNKKRQNLLEKAFTQAIKDVESMDERFIYCLHNNSWHQGIIGILASKLTDKYNRPFFIFTDTEDGYLKGSGRSIEGIDLDELLQKVSHLIYEYGGHKLACGLTIERQNLDKFSSLIDTAGRELFSEIKLCKLIEIDSQIDVLDIDSRFFEELNLLEPFGFGNPDPVFLIKDVAVQNLKKVGSKENHLKFLLKKGNCFFNAIGFSLMNNGIYDNCKIDIVGLPKINEFNGQKKWDFYIQDYIIKG